ncbi:MAG: hypothetical protein NTV87_12705 [Ignavibacteriae bacterium]|nr:hypothetical protein [Ignavibacteriota bacterium]
MARVFASGIFNVPPAGKNRDKSGEGTENTREQGGGTSGNVHSINFGLLLFVSPNVLNGER